MNKIPCIMILFLNGSTDVCGDNTCTLFFYAHLHIAINNIYSQVSLLCNNPWLLCCYMYNTVLNIYSFNHFPSSLLIASLSFSLLITFNKNTETNVLQGNICEI